MENVRGGYVTMNKKTITKILGALAITVSMAGVSPISANAEWRQDTTGWWYADGNSWYTGWKNIDNKWYYFYSSGYMAHDTVIDGYTLGADGAWIESKGSSQATTVDPAKKLSSGLTLYEAAQSIQSTIELMQQHGDKVEDNMDIINKQCENLGTTYEEIKSLPDLEVAQQASQAQRRAEAQVNAKVTQPSNQSNQSNKSSNQYSFDGTGSNTSVPKAQAQPGMQMTGEPSTPPLSSDNSYEEYLARNQGQHKDGYHEGGIAGTVQDTQFEQNIKSSN